MAAQHDDRDRPAVPELDDPDAETPVSGETADYYERRLDSGFVGVRERPAPGATWRVNPTEYAEFQVQCNLEQVGRILERLELDQADIVQLRTETRAILAGLAA
jgi:hypothetical protein